MTTMLLYCWHGKEIWIYSTLERRKSTILNWYITKYTTKAERSHATTAFSDITSTKSLASKLWNIALRSLSNRECGALEEADTLLGIPLYGTDPATVFRWVDVNII